MAERMIGSLIYGEHQVPKIRSFKQRFMMPLIVLGAFLLIGAVVYKFYNFREERIVSTFLDEVSTGKFDAAFARWDLTGGSYTMQDFLNDWGKDGYLTKGMPEVVDSHRKGSFVVVYVSTDPDRRPVALLVERETRMLSFAP